MKNPSKAGINIEEGGTVKEVKNRAGAEAMLKNLARAGWELKKAGRKRRIVARAAQLCGISREDYQRKFKEYYGMTPEKYWKTHKEELLRRYGLSLP